RLRIATDRHPASGRLGRERVAPAVGESIVVRSADDLVAGFERRADAELVSGGSAPAAGTLWAEPAWALPTSLGAPGRQVLAAPEDAALSAADQAARGQGDPASPPTCRD